MESPGAARRTMAVGIRSVLDLLPGLSPISTSIARTILCRLPGKPAASDLEAPMPSPTERETDILWGKRQGPHLCRHRGKAGHLAQHRPDPHQEHLREAGGHPPERRSSPRSITKSPISTLGSPAQSTGRDRAAIGLPQSADTGTAPGRTGPTEYGAAFFSSAFSGLRLVHLRDRPSLSISGRRPVARIREGRTVSLAERARRIGIERPESRVFLRAIHETQTERLVHRSGGKRPPSVPVPPAAPPAQNILNPMAPFSAPERMGGLLENGVQTPCPALKRAKS